MDSEQYLKAYGGLASFVMGTMGITDKTQMEADVLGWFADRRTAHPDWWTEWEEHTREGRILDALQLYVKLALKKSGSKTKKSEPTKEKSTVSGGVFDL